MKIINSAGEPLNMKTSKLVETLVGSKTERGKYYLVTYGCDCKGFIFNNKCSHIQLALDA